MVLYCRKPAPIVHGTVGNNAREILPECSEDKIIPKQVKNSVTPSPVEHGEKSMPGTLEGYK
jgi:hypothetical protein